MKENNKDFLALIEPFTSSDTNFKPLPNQILYLSSAKSNDEIKDKNNDDNFLEELLDDIFMQFFHSEEEEKYNNNN